MEHRKIHKVGLALLIAAFNPHSPNGLLAFSNRLPGIEDCIPVIFISINSDATTEDDALNAHVGF